MRAHHYCYYLLDTFSISRYIFDRKQAAAIFAKRKQIANAALLCAQIGNSSIKWTMNYSRIDDILRYRYCYITLHYTVAQNATVSRTKQSFWRVGRSPDSAANASCKQQTQNRQNAFYSPVHNLMGKLSVVHICCASLKSS